MAQRPSTQLTVTSTTRLSPALVRVELHSDDLSAFAGSDFTDRYVKIAFGSDEERVVRTYTALDPDVAAGTLAIEFGVHGDDGVAGPWAASAQPGDTLHVNGPGGAFAPDPDADWHLFAGDEAGLPAIKAALAALPADATARVLIEVEGPDHEIELPTPGDTTVTWVHRGTTEHAAADAASGVEPPLLAAVRAVDWLPGRVSAFVHGEGEVTMKGIRPYLFVERGVPRDDVSISGYWRRGRTEEGFRAWKQELRAVEGER